jgi:ribosomal RNA-processing protein 1
MTMSKKERTPKQRPSLEAISPDGNCKFSRALGSVDYQTREKGLQALTLWLSRKSEVDEKDLLKLWKGIFYCFWHSDKAHVQVRILYACSYTYQDTPVQSHPINLTIPILKLQSELAERLADIKAHLPQPIATAYFEAFIKTMRREWFGIDRIRLDKYLMLIRKFVNHSLRQLQASKWKTSQVQAFSTFLQNNVMLPEDTLPAAGVSYHIADIIIPELQNIVENNKNINNSPPSDATLKLLLAPFIKTTQLTGDPALLARLKSGFFSPLMIIAADPSQLALQHLNVEELSKVVFELGKIHRCIDKQK